MSDATLFDAPRARAQDPETSHAAARSVRPGVETAVLKAHGLHPQGLTDDELVQAFVAPGTRSPILYPPTCKSARSRLSKRGLLIDSGQRRPSDRGRSQIVWRLA